MRAGASRAGSWTCMQLTFRGVALRPVQEDDLPFLFRLWADPTRTQLWLRARPVLDEAGFHQAWRNMSNNLFGAKFIIESAGQPAGLAFDYDRTVEDGWTKAITLLRPESIGSGAGAIATTLLMDWLFSSLPLRKVYHEVYGFNSNVLGMWRKLGLEEEGVLKADRFWNGAYWDLHIFALYREGWLQIRKRVLRGKEAAALDIPAVAQRPEKEVNDAEVGLPTGS